MAAVVAVCTLPLFISGKAEASVLSPNALVSESDTRAAGYSKEKSFREAVLSACQSLDGVKYEWGGGGWNGIDCAGSVSIAYAVALGTVSIKSTPGSYGSRTLSYSGGGNPDRYGFYRPGFAGIKTSFTNGIYKKRNISPSENHFSDFETNGTKGIQSEEWLSIINTYGFKPGDMIVWWNDNNDSVNAQHITIYAGIENGVPMHWTASSTMGYFCKKPLADSSSEAGKGSFTGFMGLRATALRDSAYAGFYLDKRDPSGINYTGSVFSVYGDKSLSDKIGELRDDDSDGVYTDFYALKNGSYTKQRYSLTPDGDHGTCYEDELYIRETTKPSGVILSDGTRMSLADQNGNIPDVYTFVDDSVYIAKITLKETDGSTGKLEYTISETGGDILYSASHSSYKYDPGSDVILITNMETTDSTAGRGKGGGLFTEAGGVTLEKVTSTAFDVTSTVFTLSEGSETVATYKYSDGSWKWFDIYGRTWGDQQVFPIKYGADYVITETFSKGEPFKCVDGSEIGYEYSNDSGWTKVSDTSYFYEFTAGTDADDGILEFTVENNRISGKFKLVKNVLDEDDSAEGFIFEIWNETKTQKLATGTSASDGTVYWETGSGRNIEMIELPTGSFVLAELVPVRFYKDSTGEYTYKIPEGFTDGKDGKWYRTITIERDIRSEAVTNDRYEGRILINKSSEDGVVKDVDFKVYYGGKGEEPVWQSSPVATGSTGKKGELEFTNLPLGWYRIDEVVKPAYSVTWDDGTEGNSRIVRIKEKDDGKTLKVKAYNNIDIHPEIATELTGIDGSHDAGCGTGIMLKDTISYENLISGYEYEITGSLIDKKTGDIIKDKDGREYTVTERFTPKGESSMDSNGREVIKGTAEVNFFVDTGYLYGLALNEGEDRVNIVCYETLKFRGITIAEHKDIEDEDQTVNVAPFITTSATDDSTNTGVLTLSEQVNITDKVSFSGLAPGESYILTGTLIDKKTGGTYVDPDGRTYTEETPFAPDLSSGFVMVHFENVNVPLDETELVIFERLKIESTGDVIASHEDINDNDQTVRRPVCSTTATTSGGNKAFWENTTVTIVDHVYYENLEVGKTYYAKASLMLSDGTSVVSKGHDVVSICEFEPQEESGYVDVTLKFNSGNLEKGDRVVVTENIYDKSTQEEIDLGIQSEDIHVLSHDDLNNMDQSLTVTSIPVLGDLDETSKIIGLGITFIVTGAVSIVLAFEIRRRRVRRG